MQKLVPDRVPSRSWLDPDSFFFKKKLFPCPYFQNLSTYFWNFSSLAPCGAPPPHKKYLPYRQFQHVLSAFRLSAIINILANQASSRRSWSNGGLLNIFRSTFPIDFPRNAFQLILRNMVRFGVVVSWLWLISCMTDQRRKGIDAQLVMLMKHRGSPWHSDTLHWLDGDHCLNSCRGLLHFPGVV